MHKTNKLNRWLLKLLGRNSIRMSCAVPLILQIIIATCLISIVLYKGNLSVSNSILNELQQQMLQQVYDQLSQHLYEARRLNQINYDAFQSGLLKLDSSIERERYFTTHIRQFNNVAMTFIGLSDGSFYGARRTAEGNFQVVRNNTTTGGDSWYYNTTEFGEGVDVVDVYGDFDPRIRPWYTKAQDMGSPTFSSIYSHFVFHEPTVTASHPVYNESGDLIGVFGVDYLMSWLGNTLGELPI